jgi:subfamily B ATP-binding cassette protein MsbA
LAIWPIVEYSKKLRRINAGVQEKLSDITALLQEILSSISIVKAFSMEEYEIKKFKEENSKFFKLVMKTIKINLAIPSLMELFGSIGFGFAVYYGAKEIFNGNLSTGDFISFTAAVIAFYRPVKSLTQVNNNIQQAEAASSRIFALLDVKPQIIEKDDSINLPAVKNSIKYENISFSYENKENILQKIYLEVKAGQMVALVGPSGAGKTTVVNLLMRFYDPDEGRILIDGIDIKDVKIRSLRDKIGIVTQETILFYDTVRNNIAYGHQEADLKSVIDAAKRANADDFIEMLPKKYDTIIGERGVQLSGGQRQRLAIARAILKNPPILILDEATSSLDTESERQVQSAIKNLMENRTTFAIAHRLSTIVNADCIVVLEKGRIVDIGKHEELMRK